MHRVLGAVIALVTTPAGRRTCQSAVLWTIFAVGIAVLPSRSAFDRVVPFKPDGHAYAALGLAVSAEYCGRPGMVSGTFNIGQSITSDGRLMERTLPDIIDTIAGSRRAYCESVTIPFLNNENSSMLLMRAVLWVYPGASPADIGRCFSLFRLTTVALLAFALLRAGAAVPLVTGVLLALCSVMRDLRLFQFSVYSFLVPLLAGALGLYVSTLSESGGRRFRWAAGTFLAAGFLTAFAVNMRSSHLPIYVALFVTYAAMLRGRLGVMVPAVRYSLVALLCFTGSYWAFGRTFIAPITPDRSVTFQNYSHHVIAHPLVLSLAIPPNALSEREGIAWDDALGITLAQRMVPGAVYLGPGYEEGLFLYYLKLWLTVPREMVALYTTKLDLAGTGMFAIPDTAMEHQPVARALTRIGTIERGRHILLVYVAALVIAAWRYRRSRSVLAAGAVLATLVAALMFMESAITVSQFILPYHAYLLWYSAGLVLAIAQIGIDTLARPWRHFTADHPSRAVVTA